MAVLSLDEALPDHLLIEIMSKLVEVVGLRASVAAARSVNRLFRSCVNTALGQSLTSLTSRSFDADGVCNLVRCVLYQHEEASKLSTPAPRFVALKAVVFTGCRLVDSQAVGLLLAHAPEVETLQLEGTAVRPEETHCLAHMTRKPISSFRLGTWTALHEAVSSARRFSDAVESGALETGGALAGIYVDVCNERGYGFRAEGLFPREGRGLTFPP